MTATTKRRVEARVLLLDAQDRVLTIDACDPDDPGHQYWKLPGGGVETRERSWKPPTARSRKPS